MGVLEIIETIVIGAFILSLPVGWIWVFYHKIKCRSRNDCGNRKCTYWHWCKHNEAERKKDDIQMRIKMIESRMDMAKPENQELVERYKYVIENEKRF